MARRPELPQTIPLFPLHGAVLMPRSRLPLQIFEPRYLQMVEDVLKTPCRLIGMIQPSGGGLTALASVGCAGRLAAFSELDDGRMMIALKARSRFRLVELLPGANPYPCARVDWSGYEGDHATLAEHDLGFDKAAFLGRLSRFMRRRGLLADWGSAEMPDDETLINSMSMLLPLAIEEKQALLECRSLAERRALLEGLLEYTLHRSDNEETIQ